jgi:hypothetical protein
MSYKVSEVAWADGGYGFNITGEHSVPLVHFSYLRERDAIALACCLSSRPRNRRITNEVASIAS